MPSCERVANLLHDRRLLIFDFDGTVADTSPLHAAAFSEVLAPFGVQVNYSAVAGLSTLDAMRRLVGPAHAGLRELTSRKQQRVRQLIETSLAPMPGVDAFLRWARPRRRLAMASSGSHGTVSLALHKLGYADWFDPLVCADDVTHAKPAPDCLLEVLARTGATPQECLVFEDSDAGTQAAAAAGLACVDVREVTWADLCRSLS